MIFSEVQLTIEAAQALHEDDLFNCGAVFQTNAGYVYARIRDTKTPPHGAARAVKDLTGYTMVSYHGPLLNIWKKYTSP